MFKMSLFLSQTQLRTRWAIELEIKSLLLRAWRHCLKFYYYSGCLFLMWVIQTISLLLLSCSAVSNSLPPHGLQLARLPCPSPSPGTCSNLCPLSQGHHPTISSSAVPFSSCLQSFPTSGSFLMSQLFASGGQSIIRGSFKN